MEAAGLWLKPPIHHLARMHYLETVGQFMVTLSSPHTFYKLQPRVINIFIKISVPHDLRGFRENTTGKTTDVT